MTRAELESELFGNFVALKVVTELARKEGKHEITLNVESAQELADVCAEALRVITEENNQ